MTTQLNGKIERYHKTLKGECIRPQTPLTPDDAKRIVAKFVTEYNEIRLHSALGYVTPKDMLEGRQEEIFRERDAKLEAARMKRAAARQRSRQATEENPTYAETMSYSDLLTSRTLFRTRVGG
ncbi:MAG: integrase core domain-containing protein [Pirellulaceae bacterium]